MTTAKAADSLADMEERLLEAGHRLTKVEQIVQARRRTAWSRQWLRLALINADDHGRAELVEAEARLRTVLAVIERSLR